MMMPRRISRWRLSLALLVAVPACAPETAGRIEVRVDGAEAHAVLSLLEQRAGGAAPTAEAWTALWRTAGYTRLEQRERSLGRAFDTTAFRAFVLSDSLLARRAALAQTLAAWESADARAAATRAFAYLPPGARIRATIYPVIKPASNSFVFEVNTNPAIFLYIDPTVSAAKFENTLAHELHHVGFAGACPEAAPMDSVRAQAVGWLSAFGEGVAMLAAAGGPDIHPHAVSEPDERARWDRDMQNLDADMATLETFFTDVLDGRLQGHALTERGMSFFGVQGPWYTLGYAMASAIERSAGRARLVATLCDMPALLRAYNAAALSLTEHGERLPRWSDGLLDRLSS
jgi:hypothetical protein